MSLLVVLDQLKKHPRLHTISLVQITTFSRMLGHLRRDILLPQPISQTDTTLETAPDVLPPSIELFLATSIGLETKDVADLWDVMKDITWSAGEDVIPLTEGDFELFKLCGWPLGITPYTLYPPNLVCTTEGCSNSNPLKKERQNRALVFTHANGVQPAWNISLRCSVCNTNYFNNYKTRAGRREYHQNTPAFIEVGEHHYVESKVIHRWRMDMVFGWFSATNLSREYDAALTDHIYFNKEDSGISDRLTTEHVWDAFVIYSLLEDSHRRGLLLDVPNTGYQSHRFRAAMQERNTFYIKNGQPDAVGHVCDKCTRFYKDKTTGLDSLCQAVVGDGLSIGHPCCGVFRCREPLAKNHDRFCPTHKGLHNVCAIVGCENPVMAKPEKQKGKPSKTCHVKEHQEIERKHEERSTGSFLYKQRLQHARVSQPVDSFSDSVTVPEEDVQEDFEMYTMTHNPGMDGGDIQIHYEKNTGSVGVTEELATDTLEDCPSKSALGNAGAKYKAQFGRRRTHNDQTLVFPCGLLYQRATMYGAEAVSNFLVMVKNSFSVPGARKPQHIMYDTNCDARQQAEKDDWFKGIGMCVDAWHFRNKHAISHEYCQLNCNPAKYPELMTDDGGWFFNTSVAEQTNVWLGGYHAIVREMLPEKYNFFLDEMIRLRNIETLRRLREKGYYPRTYPPA